MPVRILILLVALFALLNLIIIAFGLIMGVNPYKKYSKQLTVGFGILILVFVTIYIILPLSGLL